MAALAPFWEEAMHSLKGLPHVIDIRNLGLVAGVELEAREGRWAARLGRWWSVSCGILIRVTGDVIALSPPLVVERDEIEQLVDVLGSMLKRLG